MKISTVSLFPCESANVLIFYFAIKVRYSQWNVTYIVLISAYIVVAISAITKICVLTLFFKDFLKFVSLLIQINANKQGYNF